MGVKKCVMMLAVAFAAVLLLLQVTSVKISAAQTTSGSCGVDGADDAVWSYSGGVLTISGSGDMEDYDTYDPAPWDDLKSGITKVVINGVTRIGGYAFEYCSNLQSVEFKDSKCTVIRASAFMNCTALTSVSFPDSVTCIETDVFKYCYNLTQVTAPGLEELYIDAFYDTGITEFSVGSAGQYIYFGEAFNQSKIQKITVAADNPYFTVKDGVVFNKDCTKIVFYPCYRAGTSYTVPAGVTEIDEDAFSGAANLEYIDWGLSSVTKFGQDAFAGASIREITIPDTVTEIGSYAFNGCSSLEKIQFGSGISEIPYCCFWGCSSLKDLVLPENIKEVAAYAFRGAASLQSLKTCGLTEVSYECFYGAANLESIELNEGIRYIYSSSFYGCSSLKQADIPSTVKLVDSDAFPSTTVLNFAADGYSPYGHNGYAILDKATYTGTRRYDYAYDVLDLVNEQREANGQAALVMNEDLLEVAMQRAAELVILFSHTRPDASYVFDMSDLLYGENIAWGQISPDSVMTSWMNSTGHKQNILSAYYTTIGIGCFEYNGSLYWVQSFGKGSDTEDCDQPDNQTYTQTTGYYFEAFQEAAQKGSFSFGSLDDYNYSLTLDKTEDTLTEGNDTSIVAYLCAYKNRSRTSTFRMAGTDLTYTSSDPSVATVSSAGVVHAVSAGTAVITISSPTGAYSASFSVTVSHSWNNGVVTKEATPFDSGSEKFTCSVCKDTREETIPKMELKQSWYAAKGKWYYFNADGAMQLGWAQIGSVWYYFNADGIMQTGWQKLGGYWYYLNGSGAMQTGWKQIGSTWYYFTAGGDMVTGWRQIGSTWYYFTVGGDMVTGWRQIGSIWYYFNGSGAMATGWRQIGSTWYYFSAGGAMQTGWQQIGGKYYYFYSSGAMASNTWIGNYYVNASGVWTASR